MISVKIGRLNSESKEYSLGEDSSISKLLEIAGMRVKDTEIITVNGDQIEDEPSEYELEEGDRVLLVRNVQGSTREL